MSYDLAVFNPEAAPADRENFLTWYEEQTEWEDDRDYDSPDGADEKIRSWFLDMIKKFPAMNGPYADDDSDDSLTTDYSIGKDFAYAGFAWSQAEEAFSTAIELAEKHGLGFFAASDDDGAVWSFSGSGEYVCMHKE